MPKQTNPDNADSPQEVGDRIRAAVKRNPDSPAQPRKPAAGKAGKTKKGPGN
jgi:hypothetical protein